MMKPQDSLFLRNWTNLPPGLARVDCNTVQYRDIYGTYTYHKVESTGAGARYNLVHVGPPKVDA